MLQGFRAFLLRGNVVDLAVAVVVGAAFSAVVTAFVKDLVTPLIAALVGTPDFGRLTFTLNGSRFAYGDFLNALVTFVLISAVIYFFVVKPTAWLAALRASHEHAATASTRPCPFCLDPVPPAATRCRSCCAPLPAA